MEQVTPLQEQQGRTATVALLEAIGDAFNRHDLDGILSFFAEDGVFDQPAGAEIWGHRYSGKEEIRQAFASLFATIPDIHWEPIRNTVSGNTGCSEWRRTGTTTGGEKQDWLGCDLFTFRDGMVIKKDSYFKIVQKKNDGIGRG